MRVAPRATYRLQLRGGFDFAAAERVVPYLAALGISHVYLSPIMTAARGSTHGYDVVDPETVDPALGGEAGFARFAAAARGAGLGLLLDIVPNHMSIAGPENRWWRDVLENGGASYYAEAFDVDWEGSDRVLLPVLGERYGRALASGAIAFARGADGAFEIRAGEQRFPCSPRALGPVVRAAARRGGAVHAELEFVGDALAALPTSRERDAAHRARRHRDRGVLLQRLAQLIATDPRVERAIADELAAINADPLALDALLEGQNYRLAHWRVASERALTHRRFFDITTLAGVRMEDPEVFAAAHRRVLAWLADGTLDGVRIDHVDGLRDPEAYVRALRAEAPDAWIVVEKIVARGEQLPASWPIDGTTGYEHADCVAGLLVDPAGAKLLTDAFAALGGSGDLAAARRRARLDVMSDALHSELARVAARAIEVCAAIPACRDYTPAEIERALAEIIAGYPVYRTYLPGGDRGPLDLAVARARQANPELDGDLVGVLAAALAFEVAGAEELARMAQQVTGAVVAKGDEDTLAYREVAIAARCEVGSELGAPVVTVDEAHARLAAAAPRGLNASATHDTKRGEDTRARLLALTSRAHAEAFCAAAARWSARAAAGWGQIPRDRALEWLVWQTLVAAWPIDHARLRGYVEKASREAGLRTSWRAADAMYEEARDVWLAGVVADVELGAELAAFAARIDATGERNVMAMTLVKLCAPGVPDFYQGAEVRGGGRVLVDPDNRAAVDFAALARSAASDPKQRMIARVLALRAKEPALFAAAYAPVRFAGDGADAVFAFARGDRLIAVAHRADGGGDARLALAGKWFDVVGERELVGEVRASDVDPVALLTR